jgi:hemerythrin-like domain-containing protein
MNALELLKQDHEAIDLLIAEIEATEELEEHQRLFAELRERLELHLHLEDTVFYPFLFERLQFQPSIEHSYQEHRGMKIAMAELEETKLENDFHRRLAYLLEAIQHHFTEEEKDLFPFVEATLTADQIDALAEELKAANLTIGRMAA